MSRGEHGVIMTDQPNAMVEVCPSLSYRMKVRTTKLTNRVEALISKTYSFDSMCGFIKKL